MSMRFWILSLLLATSGHTFAEDNERPVDKPSTNSEATTATESVNAPHADAQKGIYSFALAFSEAFNRHDAKAIAALWAKNGVHTNRDSGEKTEGREAIEKVYEAMFANGAKRKILVTLGDIRLIAKDVATAEGTASVTGREDETEDSSFAAIFVKLDGRWLLDSVQETNVPPPVRPYDHLQALEWLVGEWRDESDELEVYTNCRWSANYAFLIRSYNITREGKTANQGTQIIGWDPEKEVIRSWHFASDGSFGEGEWTQDNERWTVRLKSIEADGTRASATHVITLLDENTMTSQIVARDQGGKLLPSTDAVTVVRILPTEEPQDQSEHVSEDSSSTTKPKD